MDKVRLKNMLVAFLVTISLFSVFKYVSSLKEKYDLLNSLDQLKEQAATLETQNQNILQELEKEKELQQQISQENAGLKENLRVNEEKLVKLEADYAAVQKNLEQLNSRFALLRAENTALIGRNSKLVQTSQEYNTLKTRMGSITELKKAIRELKKKMHGVGREVKQSVQTQKIVEGNRGYLIKDGKITYPARIRIEVTPVYTKE